MTGTVQGVGFRPYVYRLAGELSLGGFVLNDTRGVLIEVEGSATVIDRFLERLPSEAPPLAVVEQMVFEDVPPSGDPDFAIRDSVGGEVPDAPVTPDTATCDDCLRELFDPADRRYRYPFINCTNCGPRFTIVRGVPYDRPLTTMAAFKMCPQCRAEYDDPADRRFHAQPNACPVCGPSLRLIGDHTPSADPARRHRRWSARRRDRRDQGHRRLPPRLPRRRRARGGDVAGAQAPGGQAVRADGPVFGRGAVAGDVGGPGAGAAHRPRATDRARPAAARCARRGIRRAGGAGARRDAALLAASPRAACGRRRDARDDERQRVRRADRLPRRRRARAAAGNRGPVPRPRPADPDAHRRLGRARGRFARHARRQPPKSSTILRRSRGYVPAALALPGAGTPRPLLACGAELKNTFCLARGGRAWVSHHIGDLENYETLRSFTEGIDHFGALFAVEPEVVAHDLHPEYLSTKYALEREGVELVGVQHHHAHLAACLAEHGEIDPAHPALGAIFDGTGYGLDGTVWGGELLLGDLRSFRRVGSLLPVALPGGERAIRQPWRMACSWLSAAFDGRAAAPAIARRPCRSPRVGAGAPADRHRHRRAGDDEHGPPVRRGRRARRNPCRGQLRGSGGHRARGRMRPQRARLVSD